MTEPFRFWADAQQHVARIHSLSERVEARNRFIRDHFESDVAQVGWRRLSPGAALPSDLDGLVIGVVLWNERDLDLLARMAEKGLALGSVFVFDLDEVQSAADLNAVMPGVGLPMETPVFAEYRGGTLVRSAAGSQVAAEIVGDTR